MVSIPASFFVSIRLATILAVGFILVTPATAGDLKVVELFTSQGCYSCPAADKLIAELSAQDERILNLEFHVDYWNQLDYRSEGNWEDPFSSSQYTERQRRYSALKLSGENGVYTPQAVINGSYGQVGSNRRALQMGLEMAVTQPVDISIDRKDATTLSVTFSGNTNIEADIFLVSFLKKTETLVTSGENHDKLMKNHNVVTDMRSIATLSQARSQPLQIAFSGGDNRGCAVLVQPARQGAILGAARCP